MDFQVPSPPWHRLPTSTRQGPVDVYFTCRMDGEANEPQVPCPRWVSLRVLSRRFGTTSTAQVMERINPSPPRGQAITPAATKNLPAILHILLLRGSTAPQDQRHVSQGPNAPDVSHRRERTRQEPPTRTSRQIPLRKPMVITLEYFANGAQGDQRKLIHIETTLSLHILQHRKRPHTCETPPWTSSPSGYLWKEEQHSRFALE